MNGRLRPLDLDHLSILGFSGTTLADVAAVLNAHEITNAKDLNTKLGAVRSPRVTVVDTKNHERVLGTIPKPAVAPGGRYFEFAVHSPVSMSVSDYSGSATARFSRITMEIGRRCDGWVTEAYLSTSAPLNELVQLKDFRLPGETFNQARARQDVSRWS